MLAHQIDIRDLQFEEWISVKREEQRFGKKSVIWSKILLLSSLLSTSWYLTFLQPQVLCSASTWKYCSLSRVSICSQTALKSIKLISFSGTFSFLAVWREGSGEVLFSLSQKKGYFLSLLWGLAVLWEQFSPFPPLFHGAFWGQISEGAFHWLKQFLRGWQTTGILAPAAWSFSLGL